MCETVAQYFKSIHIARNIRDGIEYRNTNTGECVFRDSQFDSEREWEMRGVWDVCCITKFSGDEYDPNNDEDIDIPEVALRIATEKGWVRM